MKSLILDTNAYLRLLLNDIPPQADKVEELIIKAREEKREIIIPAIVLFEISFILAKHYNVEKMDLIKKLQTLVAAPYFRIESKEVFTEAFLLYSRNNISLVDAFLIAKSKIEDAELFTFDQKLQSFKN